MNDLKEQYFITQLRRILRDKHNETKNEETDKREGLNDKVPIN